jgi:hypothetical protein
MSMTTLDGSPHADFPPAIVQVAADGLDDFMVGSVVLPPAAVPAAIASRTAQVGADAMIGRMTEWKPCMAE